MVLTSYHGFVPELTPDMSWGIGDVLENTIKITATQKRKVIQLLAALCMPSVYHTNHEDIKASGVHRQRNRSIIKLTGPCS